MLERSARTGLLLVTAALFTAPAVVGQPLDARALADALFRDGRKAAVAGDYEAACAKFAESQAIDASTGTLLNLGDCEEHQRHMVAARNYFQTALAQLGASDPRRARAYERLAALEARLPRLTIRRPDAGAEAGTVVTLDGTPVPQADFGVENPVDPGEHAVVVVAPWHHERRESIVLAEGQSREVIAAPGDEEPKRAAPPPRPATVVVSVQAGAAPASPTPPPSPRSSPMRTAGWIAGSIGVAGFALAGVSGLALLEDKKTLADPGHCDAQKRCDSAGLDAASNAKTWLVVNASSWVIGIAGVAAGAYLVLAGSSRMAPQVRIALMPLPGGAQVAAQGHFGL
jgi:hypothetical protein